MKKSILWAFSLLMCLTTYLTACDNDSFVDEATTSTSALPQEDSKSHQGTITLVDSTGNPLRAVQYKSQAFLKPSVATRASSTNDDVVAWMTYYMSMHGRYKAKLTWFGGIHPARYEGYIKTMDSQMSVTYPRNMNIQFLDLPNRKMYFELLCFQFHVIFKLYDWDHKLMCDLYLETDGRALAAQGPAAIERNVSDGLMNAAVESFGPITYTEFTVYDEYGRPIITQTRHY